MKPLNHFIVSLPKKYRDTLKLNGKEIFLDNRFQEFENRISFGEIVGVPSRFDTGAKVGDTLFFHHHVAMNEIFSLGGGLFVVIYDEENPRGSHAISYRSKATGKLAMLSGWVFTEPIETKEEDKEEVTAGGIILTKELPDTDSSRAVVLTPNKDLRREGVKRGDIVCFTKDADYRMTLDDDSVVFRMRYEDLVYVEK